MVLKTLNVRRFIFYLSVGVLVKIASVFLSFVIFSAIVSEACACPCQVTYKVPKDAGDITITKVHASTVQKTFGDIYITLPYSVRWRGSKKIKAGKKATFTFNVTSGCENGTRHFAFTRKDNKTCYGVYNPPHNFDRCGLNSSSRKRTAPVISCQPSSWRTDSPR
jgi:hypothetical protein